MYKKIIPICVVLLLTFSMVVVLSGCTDDVGNVTTQANTNAIEETEAEAEASTYDKTSVESQGEYSSIEKLEIAVEEDVDSVIGTLTSEYENLVAEITTYDDYVSNVDTIETFYLKVKDDVEQLSIRLRDYALDYAQIILSSDMNTDDMYDELDIIYDSIYDGAGDDIYDEIYDGVLDDMYDAFYDGILDEAYDTVEYKDWADARSTEYDLWSDTRSDVYDTNSDMRSEVYDFASDVRSEVYSDDIEKAYEEINDFAKDIAKMKD